MSKERKAIFLSCHTYGYYYPDTGVFECTHGGWSSDLKFISEDQCEVECVGIFNYKILDEIPSEYLR